VWPGACRCSNSVEPAACRSNSVRPAACRFAAVRAGSFVSDIRYLSTARVDISGLAPLSYRAYHRASQNRTRTVCRRRCLSARNRTLTNCGPGCSAALFGSVRTEVTAKALVMFAPSAFSPAAPGTGPSSAGSEARSWVAAEGARIGHDQVRARARVRPFTSLVGLVSCWWARPVGQRRSLPIRAHPSPPVPRRAFLRCGRMSCNRRPTRLRGR
jgi:hypothetical protein